MQIHLGENTFASYLGAKQAVKALAKELSAEIVIVDSDQDHGVSAITEYLGGVDLFGLTRVVLLKRPLANKELLSYLIDPKYGLNTNQLVLWDDGKPDQRTKAWKEFSKQVKIHNYENLKPGELTNWIKKICQQYKLKLTNQQISDLILLVGNNQYRLLAEIAKLRDYNRAHKQDAITAADFNQIVSGEVPANIWRLLDSFTAGDLPQSIKEMQALLNQEFDAPYIIAMLASELRTLTLLKTMIEQGAAVKLHPYVIQKKQAAAQKVSWEWLEQQYLNLLALDTALKNGLIDELPGLSLYLTGEFEYSIEDYV